MLTDYIIDDVHFLDYAQMVFVLVKAASGMHEVLILVQDRRPLNSFQ
jgi:hypothetical protein